MIDCLLLSPYSKRKKKSSQQKLKERYEAGDPEVDLLGEPSGKFDYYVLYPRTKKQISPFSAKKDHNQKQISPSARAKRIIKILHDYLKKHQCHFLAIFPDID